jgi:hypothetical protein
MTLSTLRYRSVLEAPKRPGLAVSARLDEVRKVDALLRTHGIERSWGETDVQRLTSLVDLRSWAEVVGLTAGMAKALEAEVRRVGEYTPVTRANALYFDHLLAENGCLDEPLAAKGYLARDVQLALSHGLQKRLLGEVAFDCLPPRWSGNVGSAVFPTPGWISQGDVGSLLDNLALVNECRAQADDATLVRHAGSCADMHDYIRRMSHDNAQRVAREETYVLCRELGAHEALEYAAIALIDADRPGSTVMQDLAAAHAMECMHPTAFSSNAELGQIALGAYVVDAVCSAAERTAQELIGVHFRAAQRPLRMDGVDEYVATLRKASHRAWRAPGDVVRLCAADGVFRQGDKMQRWVEVLAVLHHDRLLSGGTLGALRSAHPHLSITADGYDLADAAVRAHHWFLDNTDLTPGELSKHINGLAKFAPVWGPAGGTRKALVEVPPSQSDTHFGLVLARHKAFVTEHSWWTPRQNRLVAPLGTDLDDPDIPEGLQPWVVVLDWAQEDALRAFASGTNLDEISLWTSSNVLHEVIMHLTSAGDRGWLNATCPRRRPGESYEARVARVLAAVSDPSHVPLGIRRAFRHLFRRELRAERLHQVCARP